MILKHLGKSLFSHGYDRKIVSIFPALCIEHAVVNPGCGFTVPSFRWKGRLKGPLHPPPQPSSLTPYPAPLQLPMCTMACEPPCGTGGAQVKVSSAGAMRSAGATVISSSPGPPCPEQVLRRRCRRSCGGRAAPRSRGRAGGAGAELLGQGALCQGHLRSHGAILFLLKAAGLIWGREEVVFSSRLSSQLPTAAKAVC